MVDLPAPLCPEGESGRETMRVDMEERERERANNRRRGWLMQKERFVPSRDNILSCFTESESPLTAGGRGLGQQIGPVVNTFLNRLISSESVLVPP